MDTISTADIEAKLKAGKLITDTGKKSSLWKYMAVVAHPEEDWTESTSSPGQPGHTNSQPQRLAYICCKKCLKCYKYQSHPTGTKHLNDHIKQCSGQKASTSTGIQLRLPYAKTKISEESKRRVINGATKLVTLDLRPFCVIAGTGMRSFAQALIDVGAKYGQVDASEVLPESRKLSKHVKDMAEKQRHSIVTLLKTAIEVNGGIGITSDLWTDDYKKQSYISCTVRWIINDSVHSSALFCKLFKPAKKTADNIRNELVNGLAEIGIELELLKNMTFVTDRGANIKKALEGLSWLPCCCHVLNTVLYHAFKMQPPELENNNGGAVDASDKVGLLLDAVENLVGYLKRSGIASQLSSTVIQEVRTRWNTKLGVLMSVNEVFQEIQSILNEKGDAAKLKNIDIVLMQDIVNLLTPFKAISDAMEGDKYYPTMHGVLLWKRKLLDHCQTKCSDSSVVKELKAKIKDLIKDEWLDWDIYKIALFLFPTFRSLSILSTNETQEVKRITQRMLAKERFTTSQAPCVSANDHSYHNSKHPHMDYAFDFSEYADDVPSEESNEIDKYIAADFSSGNYQAEGHIGNFDVLKFWWEHKVIYPKLSKLARYIFSIPCSSASSQRIFSCAGRVEERRSRLHHDSIDDIVFLNSSLKLSTSA